MQSHGAVKHVLSKEQQLYYEYVTSAIRGNDATLRTAVFKSLREDDGLYQLLPYFTQFIAEEVRHSDTIAHGEAAQRVDCSAHCLTHVCCFRFSFFFCCSSLTIFTTAIC